jgi:hypothetical protein
MKVKSFNMLEYCEKCGNKNKIYTCGGSLCSKKYTIPCESCNNSKNKSYEEIELSCNDFEENK